MKAITKIGITGFTDNNLLELFEVYDVDGSGELDYKEFVGALYGNNTFSTSSNTGNRGETPKKSSNKTGKQNHKEYLNVEGIEEILQKIRARLVSRGIRGIISLGKSFKIMDDDNSHSLDMYEFKKACKDYNFGLSENDVEKAFIAFDRNGDGSIDYDEFLRNVRGSMNNFRKKFVDQAFSKMDKDGNGYLDINDIRGVYNGRHHPDVKSGKKTEDQILNEFLETFETHHNGISNEEADYVVTREEWQEYYENVSMSIDDDKYFELMMNNCWRINSHTTGNNEKKGWNNKEEESNKKVYGSKIQDSYQEKRNKVLSQSGEKGYKKNQDDNDNIHGEVNSKENSLLEKFRNKLLSRGGRGIIGLARQFKIFDDNNSKSLDYDEFAKAIKDFKMEMGPNDIKVLFGIFDRDGEGSVDYDEFLRAVRGEMNARRKKIVLQAFNKLDTDGSGIIEINEIKSLYNVKNHPDVKSGKKTEEDIYGEFLETFETHHNINKGTKDRRVNREEFIEYYNNISMSIDNDEYFEVMMTNAWKLNGSTNTNQSKGWGQDYSDSKTNVRKEVRPQSGKGLNSPFGTTNEPTNYSTSGRPGTGQKSSSFSKTGDEVLLKFREKLASRGTRGIMGIRRSFKICDDDNSGTIDFNEFRKLIKDYRIELDEQEVKKLFGIFDRNRDGTVDFDEFIKQIVGDMNDNRKALVKKAFNKLDKNKNGTIEIDDLRGVYSAKNHPDVRAGKKTEDEILAEFLDNFELHFSFLVNNNIIIFFYRMKAKLKIEVLL